MAKEKERKEEKISCYRLISAFISLGGNPSFFLPKTFHHPFFASPCARNPIKYTTNYSLDNHILKLS